MTSASNNSQPERPGSGLADMSPAYFGLVMATGIISLAAHMMEYNALASGLFYLNLGQYACYVFSTPSGPSAIRHGSSVTWSPI